jgi:hypothetical protein
MAFRFPNLIDPWTSAMYAPLRDPEARVRKNTLMVLSHLILNDMIKVKGEVIVINDISRCFVLSKTAISASILRVFIETHNFGVVSVVFWCGLFANFHGHFLADRGCNIMPGR